MTSKPIPKTGDEIAASILHVSKLNIRYSHVFGKSEKDQNLIYQVGRGKILVQAFKSRVEHEGFGVYVGRRRYLAKLVNHTKSFKVGRDYVQENTVYIADQPFSIKEVAENLTFTVGNDCLIQNISEADARRQSLIENLSLLKDDLDPMTRAEQVNELIANNPAGLRATARELGVPPTNLSEWRKILDLTPPMQQKVRERKVFFTDALNLVKMDLGETTEAELAETLDTEGAEAFHKQVERHAGKSLKRGLPKGKYLIARVVFDRVYPPDMDTYSKLGKLAETEHMKIDEYCKKVLEEHVKLQENS